jgi:hypothetical protein
MSGSSFRTADPIKSLKERPKTDVDTQKPEKRLAVAGAIIMSGFGILAVGLVFRPGLDALTLLAVWVSAAAAITIARLADRQAQATEQQAQIMAEQLTVLKQQGEHLDREFIAAHRPWLYVTVAVASELKWPDPATGSDGYLTLNISVENTGTAPALHSLPRAVIQPNNERFSDPTVKQRELADSLLGSPEPRTTLGLTIFPKDRKTFPNVVLPIAQADADAWLVPVADDPRDLKFAPDAFVIGVVDYRSSITGNHHQTGFIRAPLREKHLGGAASFAFLDPRDGTVPVHELCLKDSILGDGIIT